ncbi:MAG: sigma-70 family RNA polymerase sigma factor, partial [Planctomycetes bacterium]|nr:sigma-70 family RNA polymerase sigma factor [Planctomycetota bacterium]
AFELLIDRHQGKIIRFMQGWVANVQQAEDLAQDVFLRVFKARKTYVPTAKFTTWLYRIAHNIASNYLRDSSHRREYQISKGDSESTTGLLIENIAVAPSGFQPSRSIDQSEKSTVVLQALQALGERQRTAIMLSKFEGMSYQEIADTMGLSIQAVKSLLSRARVNLKNLLEPYLMSGSPPTTDASALEDNALPLGDKE